VPVDERLIHDGHHRRLVGIAVGEDAAAK
jgi:hypothetical protein